MSKRLQQARCHPDRPNHYMGKCEECSGWIRDPNAPCFHKDRPKDRHGRCASCMGRYYYLRRAAGIGDVFGTVRASKGVAYRYGPNYIPKRWIKKKLEELRTAQNNKCAICDLYDEKGLCLDHDHACCPPGRACEKCVRAALCHGCNMRLGQLESPLLERSLQYLEKYKKRG